MKFYPIIISLITSMAHFLLASIIGYVLHSYVSTYASYFLVLSFRYNYAINNFARQYVLDPNKTELYLRNIINKNTEKNK